MTECRRIESLLPPYVDGEATPDAVRQVEAHLATCAVVPGAGCQRADGARVILRARAAQLTTPAPPGLRTRIVASLQPAAQPVARLARPARRAFAAAAAVLVLDGRDGARVRAACNRTCSLRRSWRSITCAASSSSSWGPMRAADAAELERQYRRTTTDGTFGCPPSSAEVGITLVAARRCPFWLGDHAHLLYRIRRSRCVAVRDAGRAARAGRSCGAGSRRAHLDRQRQRLRRSSPAACPADELDADCCAISRARRSGSKPHRP